MKKLVQVLPWAFLCQLPKSHWEKCYWFSNFLPSGSARDLLLSISSSESWSMVLEQSGLWPRFPTLGPGPGSSPSRAQSAVSSPSSLILALWGTDTFSLLHLLVSKTKAFLWQRNASSEYRHQGNTCPAAVNSSPGWISSARKTCGVRSCVTKRNTLPAL